MKILIETLVTIFLISLTVFLSIQLITTGAYISEANRFYNIVSRQLEDSNFNIDILDVFKNEARGKGYTLEVDVQEENGDKKGIISFIYPIEIPLLGLEYMERIDGYIE